MPVEYKDKTVYFTTQPVVFKFEVGDLLETEDKVIVRLNIPADNETRRNVFALQKDAKFIWQVDSSLNAYPEINVELPYENMALLPNGNINVSDFFGRTFEINSKNGEILNFYTSR